MCKSYAEIAMEVIREDWNFRKAKDNPAFNQERIARIMGISRSQLAIINAISVINDQKIIDAINSCSKEEAEKIWLTRLKRFAAKIMKT